jgi:outer membrane protein OmpA-like peptidoglycan-associated protein
MMPVPIAVLSLILYSGQVTGQEAEPSGISTDSASGNSGGDQSLLGRPNHRQFNLHFAMGSAFALADDFEQEGFGESGAQGTFGMDFVLNEPIAFSLIAGYNGYFPNDNGAVQDLYLGMGFRLRFAVDTNGSLYEQGGNALGNLWLDIHFGVHKYEYENHGGFNIGLGYEFSIAKNFNLGPYGRIQHTPWGQGLNYLMFAFGIEVSLGAQTEPDDRDKDDVIDENDKCPNDPEDKDGFDDDDGCPDPDNDLDGVLDADDQCINLKGVPDKNGCPDDDPDRDGMVSDKDQCPYEAEDKDGFKDDDGCPDGDNDEDGLADDTDKCPMENEDKDGFEDDDGCPDPDNDNDGIADDTDECPLEPETKNEKDDEDGCPDFVRVEGSRIKTLQKVYFAADKDKILERSFPMLEEIARIIAVRKDSKVRIDGYTDDRGPEEKNLDLSKRRAESVKNFLIKLGVEENRLIAEGHGDSNPIADNKSPKGREENRRVEITFAE